MRLFLSRLAFAVALSLFVDLNYVELTLIVALALTKPLVLIEPFAVLERHLSRLARRRTLCVVMAFAAPILIRLALLPWDPIPDPWIPDEFSHLLIGDTLAHGRLVNPVHPLWMHLESIHILTSPVYASVYFPGLGIVLALGELLGHPWIGVLLSSGAMCAALTWMLYGVFSPRWALLGGALSVLRWGALSYWVNGYWGGTVTAAAGAIVLGAYMRLWKRPAASHALALGAGYGALAMTRPLEGLVVAIPTAIALAWRYRTRPASLIGIAVPATLTCGAVLAWLGYYFHAITGNPFLVPYRLNQAIYGWPLTMPWETLKPVTFRHRNMELYYEWERCIQFQKTGMHVISGFANRIEPLWRFYWGFALSIPVVFGRGWWRSPRIRLPLVVSIGTLALGTVIGAYPHYIASATGAFLIVTVQGFRQLRLRRIAPQQAVAWSRIAVLVCAIMLPVRAFVDSTGFPVAVPGLHSFSALGSREGVLRGDILRRCLKMPGQHVVFVQYHRDAYPTTEWVYNDADVDRSAVVWANDMGARANEEVLKYFPQRKAWLVKADDAPDELLPYDSRLARTDRGEGVSEEICSEVPAPRTRRRGYQ